MLSYIRQVTRMTPVTVSCPECGLEQNGTIVYSWNEALSGPTPDDVFLTTCTGCGCKFPPEDNKVVPEKLRQWREEQESELRRREAASER